MRKIAVLVKTCPGRPSLWWCVFSVLNKLREYDFRLYISDEKPLSNKRKRLYDYLSNKGHFIKVEKSGISCGKARNNLIANLKSENIIVRLDDDFELGGEFNIEPMLSLVEMSDKIGFCADIERQVGNGKSVRSGRIRPYAANLVREGSLITKKFHSPFKSRKEHRKYAYDEASFTRNLLVIPRYALEEVSWDEELIFDGEHLDFMLAMKEHGFTGVYTTESIHNHRDDLNSDERMVNDHARSGKEGKKIMKSVFKKKWGVNNIKTSYPITWYSLEAIRRLADLTYYL